MGNVWRYKPRIIHSLERDKISFGTHNRYGDRNAHLVRLFNYRLDKLSAFDRTQLSYLLPLPPIL